MQSVCSAVSLALAKAGSKSEANMAIMAITTSNSINVNADKRLFRLTFWIKVSLLVFMKKHKCGLNPKNKRPGGLPDLSTMVCS
jgi:hypothetical protein